MITLEDVEKVKSQSQLTTEQLQNGTNVLVKVPVGSSHEFMKGIYETLNEHFKDRDIRFMIITNDIEFCVIPKE